MMLSLISFYGHPRWLATSNLPSFLSKSPGASLLFLKIYSQMEDNKFKIKSSNETGALNPFLDKNHQKRRSRKE
jgi:hypothetical protein